MKNRKIKHPMLLTIAAIALLSVVAQLAYLLLLKAITTDLTCATQQITQVSTESRSRVTTLSAQKQVADARTSLQAGNYPAAYHHATQALSQSNRLLEIWQGYKAQVKTTRAALNRSLDAVADQKQQVHELMDLVAPLMGTIQQIGSQQASPEVLQAFPARLMSFCDKFDSMQAKIDQTNQNLSWQMRMFKSYAKAVDIESDRKALDSELEARFQSDPESAKAKLNMVKLGQLVASIEAQISQVLQKEYADATPEERTAGFQAFVKNAAQSPTPDPSQSKP
jgi:dynactin complex subunit